ncbi:hypothetical protein BD779DRAFT_1750985 [Infundibulicybe gibba]|nr:hypothetical protein BD779DRAFT_1750985 [Infundibulicybe gibba]
MTTEIPGFVRSGGALLIWFFLTDASFFGVLSAQIYRYFTSFPNDRIYLKLLVGGVYLLEIAQTAITVHEAYAIFAKGLGDFVTFMSTKTAWIYSPFFAGIGFIVQVFYAYRINTLYNSRKIGLVIAGLSVGQFVASQISTAFLRADGLLSTWDPSSRVYIISMVHTAIGFICNMIIATSMTLWLLRVYRGNNGHAKIHSIIMILLRATIGNGILSATMSVAAIILHAIPPKKFPFMTISASSSKWYSVTLLGSLNNRSSIQYRTDSTTGVTGIEFRAATCIDINTLQDSELPVSVLPTDRERRQ